MKFLAKDFFKETFCKDSSFFSSFLIIFVFAVQVLVVRQSELAKATPTETEALARRLAATNPTSYPVALALAVVARNGGREMAGGPRVVAALSSLAVCLQNAMDNLHNDPRLVR